MKKFFTKKRVTIIIAIIVILIALVTATVGNFFIDFALVPNNGAQDRETIQEIQVAGIDEKTATTETIISTNRAREEVLVDEWLVEVANNIEDVAVESHDGYTLRGHTFFQNRETNDWVVLSHGYQATEDSLFTSARHYFKAGYNVLTYDQRAMGNSEGEYITMGIEEQDDLITWLNALIAEHPEANIITHGESMGSATVLLALNSESYPEEVDVVIADSGYTSVWEVFESELYQRFNLDEFPFLYMAGLVGIPRVGINIFSEGNALEAVSQANTPTLFIHGSADKFVPTPMVDELYTAHPSDKKEKLVIEGAGHTESKYLDPEIYYETIFNFINQHKD